MADWIKCCNWCCCVILSAAICYKRDAKILILLERLQGRGRMSRLAGLQSWRMCWTFSHLQSKLNCGLRIKEKGLENIGWERKRVVQLQRHQNWIVASIEAKWTRLNFNLEIHQKKIYLFENLLSNCISFLLELEIWYMIEHMSRSVGVSIRVLSALICIGKL